MTPHQSIRGSSQSLRMPGERGSATLFLVISMTATVALLALIVDGGATQRARSDAYGLAAAAARAGAQQLDDDARTAGIVELDPPAAAQAANDYLIAHDAIGDVAVDDDTVTVTVERTVTWTFWPGGATVHSTAAVEAQQQEATP